MASARFPAASFQMFIFVFCGSSVALWRGRRRSLRWHSKQESAMQPSFIVAIAIVLLGITAAQAQTGASVSVTTAVGSDPLSVPTSSSPSVVSPSSGSASGTASGSTTTTGSAVGGTGAISAPASTNPQSPLILPGEIPDTSTQAASTTAAARGPSSPTCPPPVPTSDGGSANLSEIAGVSIGGC
jgi:hypothetical protein